MQKASISSSNGANSELATSYDLDLADIAEVWRRGSVISSWLLDLIAIALADDQSLAKFSGKVADSGEGRWTIDAAIEEAVPVDVLAAALFARFRSRVETSYADQFAQRHAFRVWRACRSAAINARGRSCGAR